jgi:hypothetical protein
MWATEYDALHSKLYLAGGQEVISCYIGCGGFHLRPEVKDAPSGSREPAKARALLAQVSRKRQQENRDRRRMAKQLYPEQPLCTVWELASNTAVNLPADVLAGCHQWADDLHEPLTRGRSGSITDPSNVVPLCRPCHDVITFAPESTLLWAYEVGLLRHSWEAA